MTAKIIPLFDKAPEFPSGTIQIAPRITLNWKREGDQIAISVIAAGQLIHGDTVDIIAGESLLLQCLLEARRKIAKLEGQIDDLMKIRERRKWWHWKREEANA